MTDFAIAFRRWRHSGVRVDFVQRDNRGRNPIMRYVVWPESCRTGCDRLRMPPNSKVAAQVIRKRIAGLPCAVSRRAQPGLHAGLARRDQWRLGARQRAVQASDRESPRPSCRAPSEGTPSQGHRNAASIKSSLTHFLRDTFAVSPAPLETGLQNAQDTPMTISGGAFGRSDFEDAGARRIS